MRFASPTRVRVRSAGPGEAIGPARGAAPRDRGLPHRPPHDRAGRRSRTSSSPTRAGRCARRRPRHERGASRPARGPLLALLGIAAIGQRAFLTLWRQPVLVVSTMIFPVVYLLDPRQRDEPPARARPARRRGRGGQRATPPSAGAASSPSRPGGGSWPRASSADRAAALDGPAPRPLSRRLDPAVRPLADGTGALVHRRQHGPLLLRRARAGAARRSGRRSPPPPASRRRRRRCSSRRIPYLDYLTYLGPAVVCLAIFMGSMVSGGLQVLEDRMFGYHEGYLVTPITTGTLVAGHVLAGAIVASLAGGLVPRRDPRVDAAVGRGRRRASRAAVADGLPDVALAIAVALVSALRAGAQRERPARHVRHHQRRCSSFRRARSTRSSRIRPGSRRLSAVDPLTYGLRALRDLLLRGAAPPAGLPATGCSSRPSRSSAAC